MSHRSSLLTAVVAALLLVPPAASAAQRPQIIYPENGVKVVGHEARLFGAAAKAARFWVGKRLDTTCDHVSHTVTSGIVSQSERQTRFAGRVIQLGATAGKDYCVVDHPTPDGQGEPVAVVALTDAGGQWVEELQGAIVLFSVTAFGPDTPGRVPTIDEMVKSQPKAFVALPDPDAAPPAGKVGYWSDGVEHAVFALVASTSKRRLFFETQADGVLRTNIIEYLGAVGLL
jgi:hypothetical protein